MKYLTSKIIFNIITSFFSNYISMKYKTKNSKINLSTIHKSINKWRKKLITQYHPQLFLIKMSHFPEEFCQANINSYKIIHLSIYIQIYICMHEYWIIFCKRLQIGVLCRCPTCLFFLFVCNKDSAVYVVCSYMTSSNKKLAVLPSPTPDPRASQPLLPIVLSISYTHNTHLLHSTNS